MYTIVGLGNPGSEYEGTRHNVGFFVIDELCKRTRSRLRAGRGEYLVSECKLGGRNVCLIKPLTYMNNSGLAVLDAIGQSGTAVEKMLVVSDDFQLPLGKLRIRPRGSDGGHNGLYSIIYQLQTEDFPRLRCGIQSESVPKEKDRMAQFVLEPFDRNERAGAQQMIDRAASAVTTFVLEGIEVAMNRFNQ